MSTRVDPWLTARPIAHRGLYDAAAGRPENSLAAVRHAAERGVPFEFDVQLAEDGSIVVVHDATVPDGGGGWLPATGLTARRRTGLRLAGGDEPYPVLSDVLAEVAGRVPMVVDIRRWGFAVDGALERAVAARLRAYPGRAVVQSFDPVSVARLRRLLPDHAVGQISGALHSRGPLIRALGRTMATNLLTRPDFLVYELSELPNRAVSFWRRLGAPLITFGVTTPSQESRAVDLADNFFFSHYTPSVYAQNGS